MKIRDLLYRLLPVGRRFSRIYRTGSWGSSESVSGPGSTLEKTRVIREQMPGLLAEYAVNSMLDAPCGDMNWMHEMLETMSATFSYTGADIVPALIAGNEERYGRDGISFVQANLIEDELPRCDLILCRDCLIHLSNADVVRAVDNFKRSGSRYLLTNSFRAIEINKDIMTGRWRQLNLVLPPFRFPPPLAEIEDTGSNGKFLGLWELTALPDRENG